MFNYDFWYDYVEHYIKMNRIRNPASVSTTYTLYTSPNQFVTWGSNLRLYRVLDQNEAAGSKTSEKELIGINRQEILFVCVGDKKFKFSQSF